jgi:adenosylmethionine-8-amino-7-oxononanoate aminotransferase
VADRVSKEPFSPSDRVAWKVAEAARRRGVIIRPLGDVVVLMPPLGIADDTLDELARTTVASIAEVTGS